MTLPSVDTGGQQCRGSWRHGRRASKPRPAQEVTMSTHHVFVNLEICPALLGVCTLHPPQTGGFAIADFESSETDHAKLLRLGEGATSLTLQKQRGDDVGAARDLCGQSRWTRRSALLWPQGCGESSLGRDAARVCQRHRNPSLVQELNSLRLGRVGGHGRVHEIRTALVGALNRREDSTANCACPGIFLRWASMRRVLSEAAFGRISSRSFRGRRLCPATS